MALSVYQKYWGPIWPLGFVPVANNGTPVNIMSVVDPSNNNSPNTPTTYGGVVAEQSPTCHRIVFQGIKPGANNNGMIANTGNIYVLRSPAGNGSGNRTDSGCIVGMCFPGQGYTYQSAEVDGNTLSPYDLRIDSDVDGEGALVTLWR